MALNDQPDCFELLQTVTDFLTSIEGKLQGSDKYNLQCAKHVLTIMVREIKQTQADFPDENGDLSHFYKLLSQQKGDVGKFCSDIREGKYDYNWTDTLEAVLDHVIEKVKISDPSHLRVKKS